MLVDHAKNHPTNANSADGEVLLDIEVAGAIAPKATIAVYFAPNTTAGFLDAITTAIHDTERKPSVISISWGQAEDAPHGWTAQARTAYDHAFQDAAAIDPALAALAQRLEALRYEAEDVGHELRSWARAQVSQLVTQGGFPQFLLPPVNFDALYAANQAQGAPN